MNKEYLVIRETTTVPHSLIESERFSSHEEAIELFDELKNIIVDNSLEDSQSVSIMTAIKEYPKN